MARSVDLDSSIRDANTKEESGQWGTAIPAIAAAVAQLVEHVLGKDEVIGSSPISSSYAAEAWNSHRGRWLA